MPKAHIDSSCPTARWLVYQSSKAFGVGRLRSVQHWMKCVAIRRRLKLLSGKLSCSVPGNAEVGQIPSKAQPGRAPEQIVVKLKTGLTTLHKA
jgi:hypothetical protein